MGLQFQTERGVVRKEPSGTALTVDGARGCEPDNPSDRSTTAGLPRRG